MDRNERPGVREAEGAMDELMNRHWGTVFGFLRSRGYTADRAEDLTQGFFTRFLEKGYLRDLDPERGSLRSFLFGAVRNYVCGEQDRESARKRGGGIRRRAVEADLEDPRPSPEQVFFRNWARSALGRLVERIQKEARPEELMLLSGGRLDGLSRAQVKLRRHRLRRRFRERMSGDRPEIEQIFGVLD